MFERALLPSKRCPMATKNSGKSGGGCYLAVYGQAAIPACLFCERVSEACHDALQIFSASKIFSASGQLASV